MIDGIYSVKVIILIFPNEYPIMILSCLSLYGQPTKFLNTTQRENKVERETKSIRRQIMRINQIK